MANRTRIRTGSGMIGQALEQQFEEGKITAAALEYVVAKIASIITEGNGLISFGTGEQSTQTGNIDGQWIEYTFTAANISYEIPHGLNRVPAGYLVFRSTKAAIVYDADTGQWSDNSLFLKCDTATTTVLLFIC